MALITGAGGFIGRRLVENLARDDISVLALRSKASDRRRHWNERIAKFSDYEAISAIVRDCQPKYIFHLAGTTEAVDAGLAFEVNTILGANLLRAVHEANSETTLVIAGSAAEYGEVALGELPVREEWSGAPVSLYGISKLALTLEAVRMKRRGVRVTVARLFNIVGPGMPKHLALGSITSQLRHLKGDETLKTGALDVTRDFVHVDDAVRVLRVFAEQPKHELPVVNVCSGQPRTLRLYVEALIRESGYRLRLDEQGHHSGISSLKHSWGDPSKLAEWCLALRPADPFRVASDLWRYDVGNGLATHS